MEGKNWVSTMRLKNIHKIEQKLWWEPKGGTSSIWHENWVGLGPLHNLLESYQINDQIGDIGEFLGEEG